MNGDGWSTYTTITKVLMTAQLALWWFAMPQVGYGSSGTIWEHFFYPMSHVNVWHLAGNLWALWYLKGRLYMRESYVIAVLCSFLPVIPGMWDMTPSAEPIVTAGFSGVLCAVIGIKWGLWCSSRKNLTAYWTFCKKVLPFVAVGMFIPHVNWCIHLYCLLAGLLYGRSLRSYI